MGNIVKNVYVKFNDDLLDTDKALWIFGGQCTLVHSAAYC